MNSTFAHNTILTASPVIWEKDKGGSYKSSTHHRQAHKDHNGDGLIINFSLRARAVKTSANNSVHIDYFTHAAVRLEASYCFDSFTKENNSHVTVRSFDFCLANENLSDFLGETTFVDALQMKHTFGPQSQ